MEQVRTAPHRSTGVHGARNGAATPQAAAAAGPAAGGFMAMLAAMADPVQESSADASSDPDMGSAFDADGGSETAGKTSQSQRGKLPQDAAALAAAQGSVPLEHMAAWIAQSAGVAAGEPLEPGTEPLSGRVSFGTLGAAASEPNMGLALDTDAGSETAGKTSQSQRGKLPKDAAALAAAQGSLPLEHMAALIAQSVGVAAGEPLEPGTEPLSGRVSFGTLGAAASGGLVAQTVSLDRSAVSEEAISNAVSPEGAGAQSVHPGKVLRADVEIAGAAVESKQSSVASPAVHRGPSEKRQATASLLQNDPLAPDQSNLRRKDDVLHSTLQMLASKAESEPVTASGVLTSVAEAVSADKKLAGGANTEDRSDAIISGNWSDASGSQALQGPADGGLLATEAPPMGAEDPLADQVSYWVHQKTQNAELTLDRDGQPVEVRVSLTGNEAHITFRSDQVQTRDMLDSSTQQLRELLSREGLVLSGVTVGDSGQGGSTPSGGGEAREPRDRSGIRQAKVLAASSSEIAPARPSVRGASRSVDIFV